MTGFAALRPDEVKFYIQQNYSGKTNEITRQNFIEYLTGQHKPKKECTVAILLECIYDNLHRFRLYNDEDSLEFDESEEV
jgi:hypothetical protein